MRAPLLCLLLSSGAILASAERPAPELALQNPTAPPRVIANDNRVPAGALANGVLELKLEIVSGLWFPEAETGTGLFLQMFAEEGKAPSNPGPLIRVPEG